VPTSVPILIRDSDDPDNAAAKKISREEIYPEALNAGLAVRCQHPDYETVMASQCSTSWLPRSSRTAVHNALFRGRIEKCFYNHGAQLNEMINQALCRYMSSDFLDSALNESC